MQDGTLIEATRLAVQAERESIAAVVAHLAAVDARRLYADLGFSSMFAYLTRRLGYSEEAAGRRIAVARMVQKFPRVLDALSDGRLHLTGASLLRRQMTAENGAESGPSALRPCGLDSASGLMPASRCSAA